VSGGDVSYRIRGSGLFAGNATLRDEPDLVKRFTRPLPEARRENGIMLRFLERGY
jgi:hypothetical protein